MTFRLHHLIYAAVVVFLAFRLVSFLGGEERRIVRELDGFADLVRKSGDESALALADRARRLGGYFTDAFVIALEPFGSEIRDRGTLTRQLAAYRLGTTSIDVRWADREVTVDASQRTATVTTDAVVTARYADERSPGRERFNLRFDLRLEKGDWRIDRLTLVEVVEGAERFF